MAWPRQTPWSSFLRSVTWLKPLSAMRERAWPSVKLLAPGCGAPGLFCGRVLTALLFASVRFAPLLALLRLSVPRALLLDGVVLPTEVFTFGLPTEAVPSAPVPRPAFVSVVFGLPGEVA